MKALALAVLAIAAGCEGRKAEPAGIGDFRFSQTTLKDVDTGECKPTTLTDGRTATWCFAQLPINVAGSPTEVDLYFEGTEPSARLIEIQLKVRGCNEDNVDRWMRVRFGKPVGTKSTRSYYRNSFVWAAAFLPSEPGRCSIHVLPRSEAAEIARIEQL